jgi:hypothetical protein
VADIYLAEQSVPATPSAGNAIWWPDSTAKRWFQKDSTGRCHGRTHNAAIASQGAGFATDTYVTDSDILIPSFGLQAKTVLKWTINARKTPAGVATPIYSIRIGANKTTADTARLQLTGPAQTAAQDDGILNILLTIRSIGASGVIQGVASWYRELATTGFAVNASGVIAGTSAGFDNSNLGGQYIGLSIDGGASAAWTLRQTVAEAIW